MLEIDQMLGIARVMNQEVIPSMITHSEHA